MEGKCSYCKKEFDSYKKEEKEFCSPECDTKWWRENVDGYEDYEADRTIY